MELGIFGDLLPGQIDRVGAIGAELEIIDEAADGQWAIAAELIRGFRFGRGGREVRNAGRQEHNEHCQANRSPRLKRLPKHVDLLISEPRWRDSPSQAHEVEKEKLCARSRAEVKGRHGQSMTSAIVGFM